MSWHLEKGQRLILAGLVSLLATLAPGGAPTLAGEDQWTSTGGPPGLVYAVALDPLNQGVLYVGTSTAGVFKSTDSGQSWVSMSQGLDTSAIFSLALDPTRPTTLYAGTNKGVYRSEDGALSWTQASSGILRDPFGSSYVYSLVVDAHQPSTLYSGTLMGVFKSQDGGGTWQEKNTGLRIGLRPSVEALAIDPLDSHVLYAGAGYQGLSSTLFKTGDGGESWAPLSVGLSEALVSAIAVDPGDRRRVYAGTRGQGVFASFDGGQSWQPVGQDVLETHIAAMAVGGSPTMVYAAGMRRGFYRSADGGRTWEEVGEGVGERGPTALAMDPYSASTLWLAGAGGVYKSSDGGSHWSAASRGVAGAQVVAVVPHPSEPDTLYVGAWAGGVYKTKDGGASWQAAPLGVGVPLALAMDPADPSLVYAAMFYLAGSRETGLYLSRDGGKTWQAVPGLKGVTVLDIATAPGRAYLGSDVGVLVSEDSGSTWRESNSGLPLKSQVLLLALDPRDSSHLYLTQQVAPQDLYWSKDGGQTWALLHSFQQPLNVLVPSLAAAGLLYAATDMAVLRSADGGESWQELPFSGGGRILSLAPHPVAPNTLYLGTTGAAYRSLDGGETWSLLGLEGEAVADLAISPANPRQVYGGTLGKGLWAYSAVPSLWVQTARLAFLAEPGAPPLGPALLALRDESGGSFGWAAQISSAGTWLSISPSVGASLPMTVAVSVDVAGLVPGSYQGTITLTSAITGTRNSPWQVPVALSLGPLNRRYLPWISQGPAGW